MKEKLTLSVIVRTIDKAIFGLSLLIIIFSYSFWKVIKENYGIQIFYLGTATAFIGFILAYHIRISRDREKYKVITTIALLLAINNLADELFFDPKTTGINEYLTALLIVLSTLYNYYKKWQK